MGLKRRAALTIIRRAQRELRELRQSIEREYPLGESEGEYPEQWWRVHANLKEADASLHISGMIIDH